MTRVMASLRATGQVGMLVATVQTAVFDGQDLIFRGPQVPPSSLLGIALGLGLTALAFWTSALPDYRRHARRVAVVASVLWGLLQLAVPAWLIPRVWGGSVHWPRLGVLLGHSLWPAGVAACLVASYLGAASRLDEPGVTRPLAPWIWTIAAPLVVFDAVIEVVRHRLGLPESMMLVSLAGGLLYGLMRRRYPRPDAAGWASATWPLIALIVPGYVAELAAALSSAHEAVWRQSLDLALAVTVLMVVSGLHLATRREQPIIKQGH